MFLESAKTYVDGPLPERGVSRANAKPLRQLVQHPLVEIRACVCRTDGFDMRQVPIGSEANRSAPALLQCRNGRYN